MGFSILDGVASLQPSGDGHKLTFEILIICASVAYIVLVVALTRRSAARDRAYLLSRARSIGRSRQKHREALKKLRDELSKHGSGKGGGGRG